MGPRSGERHPHARRVRLDLLSKVRKSTRPAVIIMTAFSDLDSAVSTFQGGAFITCQPFDLPKAVELIRRRGGRKPARREGAEERMAAAPEMLGRHPRCRDVFRAIGRLSQKAT